MIDSTIPTGHLKEENSIRMNSSDKPDTLQRIVWFIISITSVLLLTYTCYRAVVLSFTIDESISFNVYAQQKFMGIISYNIASSNHHMINTLCMRYMSLLFGASEFSLRFPSLLSHLVYIVFSYLIVRRLSSPLIVLAGFLLLNLNPYILDLYSLARGYGMALSFVIVSIYFLYSYIETDDKRKIFWSLLFGSFASLCSLSYLIYFLSLIVTINYFWLVSRKTLNLRDILRNNIPVFGTVLFLILIYFEPVRKLIKYEEFYDGGVSGFWKDTVKSLISSTFYGQNYENPLSVWTEYFVATVLIIIPLLVILRLIQKRWNILSSRTSVAYIMLITPCVISNLQHRIMGSNFLINRMALFLIPLFFLALTFFFTDLEYLGKWKYKVTSVIILIALIISLHTVVSINGSYSLYWKFDSDTKKMLTYMDALIKGEKDSVIKLGVTGHNEPTVNFYRNIRHYNWLEKANENSFMQDDCDYYFLPDSISRFSDKSNILILQHYPVSNYYLVKNTKKN